MTSPFPPDGSWADPLTEPEELRELGRRLNSASDRFWVAAVRPSGWSPRQNELLAVSADMADLSRDVTERAKVATS